MDGMHAVSLRTMTCTTPLRARRYPADRQIRFRSTHHVLQDYPSTASSPPHRSPAKDLPDPLARYAALRTQGTVVVAPPSTLITKPEIAASARVMRQDPEAPAASRWLPKLITSRSQCAPDLWS